MTYVSNHTSSHENFRHLQPLHYSRMPLIARAPHYCPATAKGKTIEQFIDDDVVALRCKELEARAELDYLLYEAAYLSQR